MIEWIILIYVATGSQCSASVDVSSSAVNFEQKWNSLSPKERASAKVFQGREKTVSIALDSYPQKGLKPEENTAICAQTDPRSTGRFCVRPDNHIGRHAPHAHDGDSDKCILGWD